MFKSLKDFLKKEEKGTQITLDLTGVTGWIGEQMREIEDSLERDTREARRRIPESMRRLRELVEELQSLEHDPEIHPKLKKIAKNTLPLFEKAMQSNLKRALGEEDPEEFYQTAVEILKGCVNATRAQGRYLQTVFPDQMKHIRTAIDQVGRDINTMTPIIAEIRKRKARIAEVQAVYDRLVAVIGDLAGAEKRYPRKAADPGDRSRDAHENDTDQSGRRLPGSVKNTDEAHRRETNVKEGDLAPWNRSSSCL
jgi:hypothetical protein